MGTLKMLQLETYFFVKTSVEAIPTKGSAIPSAVEPVVDISLGTSKDGKYLVLLFIKSPAEQSESAGYTYDVSVLGVFDWESKTTMTKEDIEKNVVSQGASILYTATREHIASITARGPRGVLLLPTKIFHGLAKKETPNSTAIVGGVPVKKKQAVKPRSRKKPAST